MTAPNRPSLAPKVTRGTENSRTSELEQGVTLTIEGEDFTVRVGDISPMLARELRANYGGSFNALQMELATDPYIDSISTFVWLARRVRGEEVAFTDVNVTIEQMLSDGFDVKQAGREVVDDSPEA